VLLICVEPYFIVRRGGLISEGLKIGESGIYQGRRSLAHSRLDALRMEIDQMTSPGIRNVGPRADFGL
jgi:hypothetical protein